MSTHSNPVDKDTPHGLALATTAYVLWGFLPLYMKMLAHVPAIEIVAHRVIWSIPVGGLILIALKRTKDLKEALRNPRMVAMASLAAAAVSINWGIYVYAISIGRASDGALGYYINPLFSMLLAAVLLGERLTRPQQVAIGLASVAVVILLVYAETSPWLALGLTITWGFYAYFKKSLPIGPNQGFMLEVIILSIPAAGYLAYLGITGQSVFTSNIETSALLLGCGIVTAVPLMIYANGAKLIRLSTAGVLQYIAPTLIFLIAVFVFDEEIDRGRQLAFPLIWAALIIYSVSMVREMRKA